MKTVHLKWNISQQSKVAMGPVLIPPYAQNRLNSQEKHRQILAKEETVPHSQ